MSVSDINSNLYRKKGEIVPVENSKVFHRFFHILGVFIRLGIKREDFLRRNLYNSTVKRETKTKKGESAMKRKQFTFYRSFWEVIEKLPTNKEKLQAFEMLCDYALNENEPDLETKKPSAAVVFGIARPILDKAHERAQKMLTVNKSSQTP